MALPLVFILWLLLLSICINLLLIFGSRTSVGSQIHSFPLPTSDSFNLSFSDTVKVATRFPVNQIDPVAPYGDRWSDPWGYFHTVKYCHNYPDIMCYLRHDNGISQGDKYAWTLYSDTDHSGLGAVRIRFPPRYNSLDNNAVTNAPDLDGLSRFGDDGALDGLTVYLASSSSTLRFQPGNTPQFIRNVPYDRWASSLYVDFNGEPDRTYVIFLARQIHWAHTPVPSESPHTHDPDEGRHDDL